MIKIGSHVGMSGPQYFVGSVKEALSYGANTFMFYTGAPQNTFRTPLENLHIQEALSLMEQNHINVKDVIVHAPYLINLANLNQEKSEVSFNLLLTEINRTLAMGCKYIVLHPGASLEFDKNESIKQVANYLNKAIALYPNITILIETMAGKGSEIGKSFEEIAQIINQIENKQGIGVCLDTCHIHDGGYDLSKLDELFIKFDQIISLKYLKVCHINDSKNEKDSHKDRHENFGYGKIGFENLISFIYHPSLKDCIFILETPYIKENEKDKLSYPPYKFEIEMILNKKFNDHLKENVVEFYKK